MSRRITEEREIKSFIKDYTDALIAHNAAIFVGAGFSQAAGFVNWKGLLKDIAEDLGLSVDKETDLISLAQYHINRNTTRQKINQKLITEFNRDAKLTENHKILARLPIHTCWTTNYDKLIEDSFKQVGKKVDVKVFADQFTTDLHNKDITIYKIHGDMDNPALAVLTKDDYESFNEKRSSFTIALRGQLVSKTFLWVGYSFNDPNIDYILSRIRRDHQENARQHYAIFRKISEKEFSSKDDYIYEKTKQELKVEDLRKRYCISSLLVNEYSEITEVLNAIYENYQKEHKKKTILISGSASEYGELSREEAGKFIHKLSKSLVEKGYKIVSGFGEGVGSYVINGAIESIYNENLTFDDHLILRPFPQEVSGEDSKNVLWTKYRHTMSELASIAIFVFGNKKNKNETVLADGVEEEFEIAYEHKLKLLPIGATGFMAKKLASKIINNDELPLIKRENINIVSKLDQNISDWNALIDDILESIDKLSEI